MCKQSLHMCTGTAEVTHGYMTPYTFVADPAEALHMHSSH